MDDQSFNIDALKIILQYCIGLNSTKYCHWALSGKQALQMVKDDLESQNNAVKESIYNLIFMDLNMPGMDGNTTMINIREYLF